jgi:hypothetical protein
MATPQMALGDCDIPMHAVVNILADGTIVGRVHRSFLTKEPFNSFLRAPIPSWRRLVLWAFLAIT